MFWNHDYDDYDFYCLEKAVEGELVIVTLNELSSGKIYVDTLEKAYFDSKYDELFMRSFRHRVLNYVQSYTSDLEPYYDRRKIKKIPDVNELK